MLRPSLQHSSDEWWCALLRIAAQHGLTPAEGLAGLCYTSGILHPQPPSPHKGSLLKQSHEFSLAALCPGLASPPCWSPDQASYLHRGCVQKQNTTKLSTVSFLLSVSLPVTPDTCSFPKCPSRVSLSLLFLSGSCLTY